MNNIIYLANFGGLLSLFVFIHFFVDWIFQSHASAMVKHNNPKIRAKHCLIYTIGFIPLMYMLDFSLWKWIIGLNILFWSHFIEDTYIPVFLWAKYIRRPSEMLEPWKETIYREDGSTAIKVHAPDFKKGFEEFVKTTLGKILLITIDQTIHITFLLPLVWMALN